MTAWVLILIFRGAIHYFPTDTIGTAYFATHDACIYAAEQAIAARGHLSIATPPPSIYVCVPFDFTNHPEKTK